MALSTSGLASAIEGAINAAIAGSHPIANVHDFAQVLASAIVPYLVSNTVVVPTLLVAPPFGGPVTGTGTIV